MKSSLTILHLLHTVKLTVKISSIFVAFLENAYFTILEYDCYEVGKVSWIDEMHSTHSTLRDQRIEVEEGKRVHSSFWLWRGLS